MQMARCLSPDTSHEHVRLRCTGAGPVQPAAGALDFVQGVNAHHRALSLCCLMHRPYRLPLTPGHQA